MTKLGTAVVENNTVIADGTTPSTTAGIRANGLADEVTIEGNSMVGPHLGVLVRDDPSGAPPDVKVNLNRLIVNGAGLERRTLNDVAATANWWGCQDGPTSGSSYCSPVVLSDSGAVDTSTWIVAITTLSLPNPSIGTGVTINSAFTHPNTGATVASFGAADGVLAA